MAASRACFIGCAAAPLLLLLLLHTLVSGVAAQGAGSCEAATDCTICIATPDCGWCSVSVVYENGTVGPQCAGFSQGSPAFSCPQVYSTDQCLRGWECADGTCEQTAPGTGETKQDCENTCHGHATTPAPAAKVYLCNDTSKTCAVVPPGTPGSASLVVCEASCGSNHSASPAPAALTYICNFTSFECVPTTPGHGTSQPVCETTCNKNTTWYLCNATSQVCEEVPAGTPDSTSQAACEEVCIPSGPTPVPTNAPEPSPPPEYLGVWRGVEIQNGYAIGEWDINITHSWATFTFTAKEATITYAGIPYHTRNSANLEMWILIKSGAEAGNYLYSIGRVGLARGPQTEFATIAWSKIGPASTGAPTSINGAMTDGSSTVCAISRCIVGNPYCVFTMPAAAFAAALRLLEDKAEKEALQTAGGKRLLAPLVAPKKVDWRLAAMDSCSQYDETCSVCIQHAKCGWCSTNVVYSNGQTGTQCAGFGANAEPFVCPGRYSTDGCELGYQCTSGTFECIPTTPGNGMPYAQCNATCRPTPPPAPLVPQYVCNLTSHQCSLCSTDHCPGSMPKGQCESLCPNPTPGPTPMIAGVWRGIYIQNRYSAGETDWVLSQDESPAAKVYKDGALWFTADLISLGADVMYFSILSGANKGKTFGATYQLANQDQDMYSQMTMAIGTLDGTFPDGYDTAMFKTGMEEVVLAKCFQSPCAFSKV